MEFFGNLFVFAPIVLGIATYVHILKTLNNRSRYPSTWQDTGHVVLACLYGLVFVPMLTVCWLLALCAVGLMFGIL